MEMRLKTAMLSLFKPVVRRSASWVLEDILSTTEIFENVSALERVRRECCVCVPFPCLKPAKTFTAGESFFNPYSNLQLESTYSYSVGT